MTSPKRSRFIRVLQAMCTREDDPSKVDWASVFVLTLYVSLILLLAGMIYVGAAILSR